MKKVSDVRCFGGRQIRFEHDAKTLNCVMQFSVYLPEAATQQPVPAVYFL